MSRESFRKAVFERDGYKCVFCKADAVDAHHLIERRLWEDGGYEVDNGISVCADCHMLCEQTLISVEEGRDAAGITNIVLPEKFDRDNRYDKWGNIILDSGSRSPGELWPDPSVQSVLRQANLLSLFVPYIKYPKTYHLPWSHPTTSSDRVWGAQELSDELFGLEIVVTEKLDGENISMYNDKIHARAIDSGRMNVAQSWVKQYWSQFAYDIPYGMRICGENMYAKHSIQYDNLETYFYGFSVWDWHTCLSWDDTLEWFELLGITPVPVLYEGEYNETILRRLKLNYDTSEGYVVRRRDAFSYRNFRYSVGKYVRPNHLRTSNKWSGNFVLNQLKEA